MGSAIYFYIVRNTISQPEQQIRELRKDELKTAAELLARGMRDNPINVQAFGTDKDRRRRALTYLFLPVLRRIQRKGKILGSFRGGEPSGVLGMFMPGCCQPSWVEMLRFLPYLVWGCTLDAAIRVKRWMDEWHRRDLQEPHWHLGPLAVDTPLQGQGIGSALISSSCTCMDKLGTTAYLETDKMANVRFYERFGFVTVQEGLVLGIPNWFMKRPAGKNSA